MMNVPTRLLCALSSLWVASCATTPERDTEPPVPVPKAWSGSKTATTAPKAWLSDFRSPALEAIVEEALRNNPDLQITAARLSQSIAEARIAGANQLPSSGFGLDAARQQIATFGPQATDGIIFEDYALNFSLDWELDLWGRLRDQTSAALAEVEASAADFDAARLSLAARTAKAWFNYLTAIEQVELAEKTAAADRENAATIEARFNRGLADGLTLRRIRVQTLSSEADVAARQRDLDQAARSLEVLIGRYPEAAVQSTESLPDLPDPVPAGIPAELIARRPDLVAAERRLAAADQSLSASRKELLPRISLTASGGTSSQEFDDLLDSDFSVWRLAGNLSQPIFQGGRIIAGIDRSASLLEQAQAAYVSAALQAYLEVETTLAAEQFLITEQERFARASVEADAAEHLAWERFGRGTIDFIDALDTERTASRTRTQALSVKNLLLQNRIDLHLALGGPFQMEP